MSCYLICAIANLRCLICNDKVCGTEVGDGDDQLLPILSCGDSANGLNLDNQELCEADKHGFQLIIILSYNKIYLSYSTQVTLSECLVI